MGHVTIAGSRRGHQLRDILIDNGTSHSAFTEEVLKAIGACELPAKTLLVLGDGKVFQLDAYVAILGLEDRQSPAIAVTLRA